MPNSKQKKMRGKMTSPSIHRAVLPLHGSPPSYFITIKIPAQPKIRIKIPKLLSKTMQKRFHGYNKNNAGSTIERDDDDHKPKRTKSKSGRLIALRTVGSIFNNVMKKVGFGLDEAVDGVGSDVAPGRDEGVCVANDTVSRSVVVIGRRENGGKFITVSKRELQNRGMTRSVRSSLRNIGSKRFDLKCLDLRHTHVAEEREGLELCKKRILMGSKCKPLSISGALHYDKNGILLPEELP